MAQNDFNVGSDTTLSIVSNGVILAAQILTEFEPRQIAADLKSVAMTGDNNYRYLEEGWEGTLSYDRADSTIDDYFAAKEAGRYAGQQPPVASILETTTNVDGTIVKYRYDGVTMKFDSAGSRKGDSKVEQKLSWKASTRVKVT